MIESASRDASYALMLELAGRAAEARAWLQRAQLRIGDDPRAPAGDIATLDLLRLLTFAISAGAGDEIDAGRRAVEAVEAGMDLGVAGAWARTNLVRGYLLVDKPGEAAEVLGWAARAMRSRPLPSRRWPRGSRCGKAGLSVAEHEATVALDAAAAFGLDTNPGVVDARLALAGTLIDRNEIAAALAEFQLLDEVIEANPFTLVHEVLLRLERLGRPPPWITGAGVSPGARPAS